MILVVTEIGIATLIVFKIKEVQDLVSKLSCESVTLEGTAAIKEFGTAATDRIIKGLK